MSVLAIANVRQKLQALESSCHQALLGRGEAVPLFPARDVSLIPAKQREPRAGLAKKEGQARLLHDLANIELQAMELAYRGLLEYPDAPEAFRQELLELTLSEGRHLQLCLDALEALGFQWGAWPVHLGLWTAVEAEDPLLDRLLIVHRYLEGSGLDAGDRLLERLRGMPERGLLQEAVEVIHQEEIGHVDFGSRWYREICRQEKLDPSEDFARRLRSLGARLPTRTEKLAKACRLKAGFEPCEIEALELWQKEDPRLEKRRQLGI